MCTDCEDCVSFVRDQVQGQFEDTQRKAMFGHERPLNMQGAIGADPSYSNQVGIENERIRNELFGYSRNSKGEQVPYTDLVKAAQPAKWKCPGCGCEMTLLPGQTPPIHPVQGNVKHETVITEQGAILASNVEMRRREEVFGHREPLDSRGRRRE